MMSIPSTKVLFLIAVGLFIFGQCLIAPNATRKPVTTADGGMVYRSDGTLKTELDTARYLRSNWEGFTFIFLSFAVLLVGIGRFAWSWIHRLSTQR